jgi:hypothetical protein
MYHTLVSFSILEYRLPEDGGVPPKYVAVIKRFYSCVGFINEKFKVC